MTPIRRLLIVAACSSLGAAFAAVSVRLRPPVISIRGQLWYSAATNYRFSGNVDEFHTRLVEAIDWIDVHAR